MQNTSSSVTQIVFWVAVVGDKEFRVMKEVKMSQSISKLLPNTHFDQEYTDNL
jgi:hypothetical protein